MLKIKRLLLYFDDETAFCMNRCDTQWQFLLQELTFDYATVTTVALHCNCVDTQESCATFMGLVPLLAETVE